MEKIILQSTVWEDLITAVHRVAVPKRHRYCEEQKCVTVSWVQSKRYSYEQKYFHLKSVSTSTSRYLLLLQLTPKTLLLIQIDPKRSFVSERNDSNRTPNVGIARRLVRLSSDITCLMV